MSWSDPVSTHNGGASSRSAGRSPSADASSARDAEGGRCTGALACRVQTSPIAAAGMTPTFISSVSASPADRRSRTTWAVPSVGCPANGISKVGVKMRTFAVALADGRTNVVSDRLNCSASACIAASSRSRASSKTHSGLPASGLSAKTLTRRKSYWRMVMPRPRKSHSPSRRVRGLARETPACRWHVAPRAARRRGAGNCAGWSGHRSDRSA